MSEFTEEKAKEWIMNFHKFRIHGMFTEKQKVQIWKKVCKHIQNNGFTFEDAGFYEYKFKRIGEND